MDKLIKFENNKIRFEECYLLITRMFSDVTDALSPIKDKLEQSKVQNSEFTDIQDFINSNFLNTTKATIENPLISKESVDEAKKIMTDMCYYERNKIDKNIKRQIVKACINQFGNDRLSEISLLFTLDSIEVLLFSIDLVGIYKRFVSYFDLIDNSEGSFEKSDVIEKFNEVELAYERLFIVKSTAKFERFKFIEDVIKKSSSNFQSAQKVVDSVNNFLKGF